MVGRTSVRHGFVSRTLSAAAEARAAVPQKTTMPPASAHGGRWQTCHISTRCNQSSWRSPPRRGRGVSWKYSSGRSMLHRTVVAADVMPARRLMVRVLAGGSVEVTPMTWGRGWPARTSCAQSNSIVCPKVASALL